jgi:hypothetical protein
MDIIIIFFVFYFVEFNYTGNERFENAFLD